METDGKEMKVIANTTGEVAILAAKDSAAMRIIADLTMVFLPATYVVVWNFDFTTIIRPVLIKYADPVRFSIL